MKIKRITSLTFFMYIILVVLNELWILSDDIIIVRIIQVVGLVLFVLGIKELMKESKYYNIRTLLYRTIFLLFITSFFSGIAKEAYFNFLVVFNILGFFGAALFIVSRKQKLYIFDILFWIITLLFSSYVLNDISPKYWTNGSYNHVSVLMIFLVIGILIQNIRNNKRLNLIPVAIVLLFSIYATGRGGIISSILLFIVVLYLQYIRSWHIIFVIVPTIFIYFYYDLFLTYWQQGAHKFYDQGFYEEGRQVVYDYYLKNITISTFFFGVDFSELIKWDLLTTHNSYISLHSRFGIGIFVVFFQIYYIIKNSIIKNLQYHLLLLVVLIRSFTDSLLVSDGFMFGIVFYVLYFSVLFHDEKKTSLL